MEHSEREEPIISRQRETIDQQFGTEAEEAYDEQNIQFPFQFEKERLRNIQQSKQEEQPDDDFEPAQLRPRARSDGEILENHRFGIDYEEEVGIDYEEEEEGDSNQISLIDDGENYIEDESQEYIQLAGDFNKPQGYIRGLSMVSLINLV